MQQNPEQQIVALPDSLSVGADYGLTIMLSAPPAAWRFAFFILSNDGQHILANHGFTAPGLLIDARSILRRFTSLAQSGSWGSGKPEGTE